MEIDTKAGAINYLTNHQDSLFFVQKNKCGHIPVDRTLISDTAGTASLIASSKFLGTPRYYVGEVDATTTPSPLSALTTLHTLPISLRVKCLRSAEPMV